MVDALPDLLFRPDDPAREALRHRAQDLAASIDAARAAAPVDWTGPTLLLADIDPLLAFGRHTYLDDLWTMIGSANAVAADGWIELTLEDVQRLDPAAIVVVESGVAATSALDPATAPWSALDVRAVRSGRLRVVRHPDALRPSAGVVAVIDLLRQAAGGFAESAP
ncbi:MAG: hypothetical protein KDA25_03345, partial [Phycisphaerales bacterium]|nr:hypothetical protein [Phycisphaerales bacterium]